MVLVLIPSEVVGTPTCCRVHAACPPAIPYALGDATIEQTVSGGVIIPSRSSSPHAISQVSGLASCGLYRW